MRTSIADQDILRAVHNRLLSKTTPVTRNASAAASQSENIVKQVYP
jgi:hypothetical protein